LLGIIGPRDAGKTCLLGSFFLQLANGQRDGFAYRFASSLTLHDFRELAQRAAAWSGSPDENVVDHTTIQDELKPRLFLHLGLRPEDDRDDRHLDVLLSDLPGEWFKHWSETADDATLQRMRFVRRCDAFLVLADAAALMAKGSGKLDNELSGILRRLVDVAGPLTPKPAVALVFSKFDRVIEEVPEGARGMATMRQWRDERE